MKDFIVNVNKNKKWITLGLSILYLLLFCFPMITFAKSYEEVTYEELTYYEIIYGKLPFILFLVQFLIYLPNDINAIKNLAVYDYTKINFICNVTVNLSCCILMLTCFVLAIICLVRLFKGKKFQFVWSLAFAFLTMLIKGIRCASSVSRGGIYYKVEFYPTTYIFLILLILDIVYLILERYYLFGLKEKIEERTSNLKAERQAQKEAEYKQSPEYRIEQLEKQVQELQSQVKSDDDSQ